MLADKARITFTPPDTPLEQIAWLTVQSTLTGGLLLKIAFNAGFTAIIGGRGSGKTALLEYLRFALGRTENDINPERKGKKEREAELINDTLADGYVEVSLEREGVRETWRRGLATRATITCMAEDGSQSELTLSAARERFRARAFCQKGLSNTMTDQETAAEQITGIAAAEELDKQRAVDQAISNAKRSVTTAL